MLKSTPNYYPPGINVYVPKMKYDCDVIHGPAVLRLNFGPVVVANATGILSAQSINTAGSQNVFAVTYLESAMGPWGRNLTVIASGAATSNVTVKGTDYLGQPMAESFTLNGAASVVGLKAFKRISLVTFGATAATTINLGWGTKFGLPFKTIAIERELAANVLAAAGTLAAPVFTDPQTSTTGDPRGTYIPTTTPNGTTVIEADAVINDFINSSGNGGLHGIRQAAA